MASTHAFNSALSSVDWIVMRLESDIPIYPDFVFVLDEEEYDVVYMKDETEKELCAETNKVVLERICGGIKSWKPCNAIRTRHGQ
jgi:hypothetical protein